jgi:hypothetical protein
MDARPERLVERLPLGQRRHCRAVAACAEALCVTGRAQIPGGRRARSVLAKPVAFVHDMRGREHVLATKIHMTSVARARGKVVLVLVAREADRHRRPHVVRVGKDAGVTARALPMASFDVRTVLERQVRARERGGLANVREAMAAAALARVVGRLVTSEACLRPGDARLAAGERLSDARVALTAVDPLVGVLAMRERLVCVGRADAQNARAPGQRDRGDQEDVPRALHRPPPA